MSIHRSPTHSFAVKSGSTSDISRIKDDDPLITFRKRKQPEHDCNIKAELSDFRAEMMTFLTTFSDKQNDYMLKIREEISSEIKDQLYSISSYIEKVSEEQAQIKADMSDLKSRISTAEAKINSLPTLQDDLDDAHKTIKSLQSENNINRQFSMINNIEISGVPFTKGENLVTILRNICSRVGYTLSEGDVDTIHRVRRYQTNDNNTQKPVRPPAVVVRFTRRIRKDELLAAVRARRGLTTADIGFPGPAMSLYAGDHLTPTNKLLLKRARQLKDELHYTFLWVRDCKIFMRKNEHSRVIHVNNESDLGRIQ